MSFLCYNATAVFVALVSSVVVWLFGGTRGDLLLRVMPWLLVMMVEMIFCFPQRHTQESTYEARERMWKTLKRDPVTWLSVLFLVLLCIPFLNIGLCPTCDARLIAEGHSQAPAVPFLPFCVNRLEHLNVVLWFATALLSVIAVRNGLTKKGKRLVLELVVWNGAALAAFGFLQNALGAPGPFWSEDHGLPWKNGDFFASFGYPNMAGDYFTTLFVLAVALWRDNFDRVRRELSTLAAGGKKQSMSRVFWRYHHFLIPAVVFFFAALNTLSRSAIIMVNVIAVIAFFHTLVSFLAPMRKARRVTVGAWSVLLFAIVMLFACMFMPKNIQKEVNTLGTMEVLNRVTGKGQYHSRVAPAVWRDHVLFGCGGWGYKHFCTTKMTPQELKGLQTVGGINVHNDYLQFLAEHGLVGFTFLVVIAVMLIWPICRDWRLLVKDTRFKKGKDLPAKPVQIFALPAPAFLIFLGAIATLIHAFGDCPFRSPAILTLFYVMLAAMPGFMPRMNR